MSNRLFIKVNDKRYGPFDMAKIRTLAATGKLLREHLLSNDGVSNWMRAGDTASLFPPTEATTDKSIMKPSPRTPAAPRDEATAELQTSGQRTDGAVAKEATKFPKPTLSNRVKMGLLAGMLLTVLLILSGICWSVAPATSTTQTAVAIPRVESAPSSSVEDHHDEEPVAAELRKLKGTYRLLRGDIEGNIVPAAFLKGARLRIDGKNHFRQFNGEFVHGTVIIDPAPDLKVWDPVDSDGLHAGVKTKGIYKFEGDTLTIATAAPGVERPTEFMTEGHPGQARFVWKRIN